MFPGSAHNPTPRQTGPIQIDRGVEPVFCPRCGELGVTDDSLCPNCGEFRQPCGYCPTCEAFWKLPVGIACPKHETELETAPPAPNLLGRPGQTAERWVTVATYAHPNEANAPRIRLEAEGVPTFLDGARIAGATLYQVATGGVRLQVPESLATPARILLAQTWNADLDPAADEELDDDPWVGLAPEPGTRRRTVMKGVILAMLVGPGLISALSALARGLGWLR